MKTPIRRILIANRGEIACRIMRSCQRLGYECVAVFSDADQDALHVKQADLAVALPGVLSADTYLNIEAILSAAQLTHCDAIHPGYGFLSENSAFAKRCEEAGIRFIGPKSDVIQLMGSKAQARKIAQSVSVPVAPGYEGVDQSDAVLLASAKKIGFPVLLKPAWGGGGKGMHVVKDAASFSEILAQSRREALSACGNDLLVIEKYISPSRHIEVQVVGDAYGNLVHLFERDCSIQRRHQKIVEETPAELSAGAKRALYDAALRLAAAVDYTSVGTVEFLVDADENCYFLEMNTRLQVEHPVTEMTTGIDLVAWQIAIAEGKPLPLTQEQIVQKGHAIECRLYAEDPDNQFLPQSGTVQLFDVPQLEGVRVDAGVETGCEVPLYYDPIMAKFVAYGEDRKGAVRKMAYVLKNSAILGVKTNQRYLLGLMDSSCETLSDVEFTAVATVIGAMKHPGGFRNNRFRLPRIDWMLGEALIAVSYDRCESNRFACHIADNVFNIRVLSQSDNALSIVFKGVLQKFSFLVTGDLLWLSHSGSSHCFQRLSPLRSAAQHEKKLDSVAPMPGRVVNVLVQAGDNVVQGQKLAVLEAMKMEHTICASANTKIAKVLVTTGQIVSAREALFEFE